MKKSYRLYNVFFPIWFLFLFPMSWLVVLPVNFAVDTLVILLTLKICAHELNRKEVYFKSIFSVWGLGFAADLAGAGVLMLTQLIDSGAQAIWSDIANGVARNPFESVYSLLYVAAAVFISAMLIYVLNNKFALKKAVPDEKLRRRLALNLAIFTAPYTFFVPTLWLYSQL